MGRLKEEEEANNPHNKIDYSKFLEVNAFNDFKNTINTYNISLEKRFEEIDREIDDLNISLDDKADKKEIKVLQDALKVKIEDLRSNCFKKLCEKSEAFK